MRYLILSLALSLTCACAREPEGQVHASPSTTKSPPGQTTAMDQSNDPADIELAQRVRKALVDDEALSVAAKNITAVAKAGHVTLRGTVANADEESRIKTLVKGVAGVTDIVDEIDVKK